MARSVTLTPREVRAVYRELFPLVVGGILDDVRTKLQRAMERAPTKARPRRKPYDANTERAAVAKFGRAAEKRERRAAIREKVAQRAADAGGLCECGCGQAVRDDDKGAGCYPEARGEMDHFWGRGKGRESESVESCWFLRPACHLAKTRNHPDAATWLRKFMEHCKRHRYYDAEHRAFARLAFVTTRSGLPAAPMTRAAETRAAYKRLEDMR